MIQFYRGVVRPVAEGGWFYFKTYDVNLRNKPTRVERIALTLDLMLSSVQSTRWERLKFKLSYIMTKNGCLIKTGFVEDPLERFSSVKHDKPAGYRLTLKMKSSKKRNLKLNLKTPPDIKSFLTHELPEVRKLAKGVIRNEQT